jgi:hypothetical protein
LLTKLPSFFKLTMQLYCHAALKAFLSYNLCTKI